MAKKSGQKQSKTLLSSQALSALGISKQPFASQVLTNDGVYLTPGLSQIIDSLKHHMQFSPLMLVVEGEYGSGKTTLFRYLSQLEITNIQLLPIQVEASDTLAHIQVKMSQPIEEHGAAHYLDEALKALESFDTIPVLMIDDAHTLSDTVLQELLRYQNELKQEKETELKILLLANPGMATTLEKVTHLNHRQLYVQSMPVFDEKQILNFCQHLLLSANYSGQPVLDTKDAQQILKKSRGIPANILQAAINIFEKKLKNKKNQGTSASSQLLPLVTLTIITAGFVIYFLDLFNPASDKQLVDKAPVAAQQPELFIPAPEPQASQPEAEPAMTDNSSEAELPVLPALEAVPPPAEAVTETTTATEMPQTSPAPDMALQAPQPPQPAKPLAPPEPETPAEPPAEIKLIDTRLASAGKPAAPAPRQAAEPAPASNANKKIQAGSAKPTQSAAQTAVTPKKQANTTSKTTASLHPALAALNRMGIHDSQWLLQQDKNSWTLQILGARDPQTLVNFAEQHRLSGDSAWYETQLAGKPWYILVHRMYSNQDIARESIASLPAKLQQTSPWIKSMADIHKAIQ